MRPESTAAAMRSAGASGLFAIALDGGDEASRAAFIDTLDLFGIGYSWGGFESLATPVDPTSIRTASPWPLPGMDEADRFGIRLAIGLEDAGDLIADLEAGFKAWNFKAGNKG